MIEYYVIAVFSGILSSFSQVLLKKSAQRENASLIKQYINPYVIGGYFILGACMLMMIVAYKGVPYKYGAIIEALSYFYIMILSRMFFGEKITKKKLLGNLMIIVGVIAFSIGG